MKVNLDYKRTGIYAEETKDISNQEMTANYINYVVGKKYPEGLKSGSLRRSYARLQRALDDAVENNQDEIELEQSQKDLLKECFKDSACPAGESKYFVVLEDEIDKLDGKETPADN